MGVDGGSGFNSRGGSAVQVVVGACFDGDEGHGASSSGGVKRRVLVCAPSNAAIDEIIVR